MSDTEFALHERLLADTTAILDWPLSAVRLMNDAAYTWIILVPRRPDVREIHELATADQSQAMAEIAAASETLQSLTGAHKINVGALGNLVPQLHIHVVARYEEDPAWPGPVWGHQPPAPLTTNDLDVQAARLRQALEPIFPGTESDS